MREALCILGTDQAVTTAAKTTDTLDLAVAGKHLGYAGRQLYLHFLVTTTFTGLASGLRLEVADDDNAGLTSRRILVQTAVLAISDLVAGARFTLPIWNSYPGGALQRYLAGYFGIVTEAATAGAVTSWIDDVPN